MVDKKSHTHDESDDIVLDDADLDVEIDTDDEATSAAKIKALREKLRACQKERQEYLDGWQRAQADHLNSKKRIEGERAGDAERHAAHFIETLLPLCDSFDMALRSLTESTDEGGEWRSGIERIYDQLMAVLKRYNVTVISPLGQDFDPHMHEAVSEATVTDPAQHNIIMDVLQKGYAIDARLIRPAKVVVGNHTN